MFTLLHQPITPSYRGVNHSRMLESMEQLSDFAFKRLARLRRIVGDGGQARMQAPGCRGAARLLDCSPASVFTLLRELDRRDFVRWWTDEAGYICVEVMPPTRSTGDHGVIAPAPAITPPRSRRDRGRAVPPLAVLSPESCPPVDGMRSRRDRASIHDHDHEKLASSEPVASAPAGQPDSRTAGQHAARTTEAPDQPARTPTPQVPAPPPPADPRVAELAQRGVYAGLARRVLEARPELGLGEFDRLTAVVERRGRARLAPAVIVASVLARGEQVDEGAPAGYRPQGAQCPPQGERVSDSEITLARIDPRDRQLWLGRFRAADTPAAKRQILDRFRHECLGTDAGVPARSA